MKLIPAHIRIMMRIGPGLMMAMLLLAACRKDPALESEAPFASPTPLTLELPAWTLNIQHPMMLPADNPLTVEGVQLGRRLFYEKALSDNYSLSCASCHQQAHAFSDPQRFSLGTDGSEGRRQSMPIQNTLWDHAFFWDGRAASLEEQALGPVVNHVEMRNTWPVVEDRLRWLPGYAALFTRAFGSPGIDSMRVVKAIAQFERTLLSFDSPFDRFFYEGQPYAMSQAQLRGMDVFFGEGQCDLCHRPPLFQDHDLRNIGLPPGPDQGLAEITGLVGDRGRFKVNSLRNIALTAPYMHDGRYATLEEVIDFYADSVNINEPNLDNHMWPWTGGQIDLDAQERADLKDFMEALTDQRFVTNPAFSDPN
jgi:cytochrome c peroxidase